MPCLMKVVGFANGIECPIAGQYLKSFDFNAENGLGYGEFTDKKEDAQVFADVAELMKFYVTVSLKYPMRGDGQPNRPLTCTTITAENV